jgi:hypothetical protein
MDTPTPPQTPDRITADEQIRPWQFSLKQLLLLMVGGGVLAAAVSWLGTETIPIFALIFVVWIVLILFVRTVVEVVTLALITLLLISLLLPAVQTRPRGSRRSECGNNLRQIVIALQNYHDVYGSFPPAYVADKSGRPMHSWRVLVLPFLEQKPLYDQYRFDEPWDGPNNAKLASQFVRIYGCPSDPHAQSDTHTSYVAVVGPGTAWPGEKAIQLGDIKDGTSSTLLVVEVHNAGIHWMEPRDLHLGQMPLAINPPRGQGISSEHPSGVQAAFADGRVQFLLNTTPPDTLRGLLTIDGGETVVVP